MAAASGEERCHLLALSHDELGVVFGGLADPLEPAVAVALSGTCKEFRAPLRALLEVLKERHLRAVALCRKVHSSDEPCSCTLLRDAEELHWYGKRLTTDDMATLGIILRTNGLPRLRELGLVGSRFGDAGMQALCEGLGRGAAQSHLKIGLNQCKFGQVGAEALAAALGRGAMPKLVGLFLGANPIGNQAVGALSVPLRKLPALKELILVNCNIGDEGVTSLVANLGKHDFKALEVLALDYNKIKAAGCAALASALTAGAFPRLNCLTLDVNPHAAAAREAVDDAMMGAARARAASRQKLSDRLDALRATFISAVPGIVAKLRPASVHVAKLNADFGAFVASNPSIDELEKGCQQYLEYARQESATIDSLQDDCNKFLAYLRDLRAGGGATSAAPASPAAPPVQSEGVSEGGQ